jgi:membrane dipeptidase
MKKILRWSLGILLLLVALFFLIAPAYIDRSKNKVSIKGPFAKNSWYDSIPFIADLHCDALLWGRNLSKEHSFGHVDLPRMQQANMAMQIFTVVSKVPAGINIEKNEDHSDQIGLLSFAQLQPISNWFGVKERALRQCCDLHELSTDSKGEFRVIETKQDLVKLIAERATNATLTSGMLGLEGAHCLEMI